MLALAIRVMNLVESVVATALVAAVVRPAVVIVVLRVGVAGVVIPVEFVVLLVLLGRLRGISRIPQYIQRTGNLEIVDV